jgi:hypothetical protein
LAHLVRLRTENKEMFRTENKETDFKDNSNSNLYKDFKNIILGVRLSYQFQKYVVHISVHSKTDNQYTFEV